MANNWMKEADEEAKKYADYIRQSSQYLIDNANSRKQAALDTLENQRTNAINELNSGKDTVRNIALDSAKQANINRMLALKDNQSAMSRAGLSTQGIVGSQVNSINNSYGNNLNSILSERDAKLKDIDDQVNAANIQYDTNRINTSNEYDSNIANIRNQIDQQAQNEYNTAKNLYLAQKQQEWENEQAELARQEQIRQFNEQMAYQREQDKIANAQKWASIRNNYTFNEPTSHAVNTDWWQGDLNEDTKYGTFTTTDKNGVRYQPNNYKGDPLKSSGYKVQDLFGPGNQGKTGANIDNQTVWKSKNGGRYYIWDGSQNQYIDVTNRVKKK